ncbi:SpoVG family protein [Columbia Basin potato purple top phytoplasma]|uniref:Septation protein spoVG n=1 Tax=Columbia Basin potato purple top phytoplasma TaxID=307134 RepID=A0ABT5L7Y1_9MOLU|nr:septation protein spoVG [Columbia Basin potato purple top phytoplasma]
MEITCVRTNLLYTSKNKLKAIASIIFNNCFVVRNIKVMEGEKGLFIAMPSTKNSKGVYVDIAHPIKQETRKMIEENIKKTFQNMVDKEENKMEIKTHQNIDITNNFRVTDVKVNLHLNSKTRLRAKASIKINNCFVIHGIKIIEGERSLFIAMPSTKNSKGVYVDIAHPIKQETRQMIETECKKVFQEMMNNKDNKANEKAKNTNNRNDENDNSKIENIIDNNNENSNENNVNNC